MMKPILKKLSHSEKNSLDLDRGWDEQQRGGPVWSDVQYESAGASRSAKDVSFIFAEGNGARPRFQHARSTSGTSVATTGSGGPRAPFVHPFQQTPRTATPPLSYANSLASFDNGTRDYSPTITENEDDDDSPRALPLHHHPHSQSISQSSGRRPSLASQRTASFTDITVPPRITPSRSFQGHSRLPYGSLSSSVSHSDLHLNLSGGTLDSPASGTPALQFPPPAVTSPISSSSMPLSPLRSSLESVGFPRLRSKSELDSGLRADNIREARRKFEARERAKDEKAELKARRRKDSCDRPSRSTPPNSRTTTTTTTPPTEKTQLTFMSSNYESMAGGTTPRLDPGLDSTGLGPPARSNTAKKKTQGVWNGFILWLRTRLLRLGKK
jgi:hypothetical protein